MENLLMCNITANDNRFRETLQKEVFQTLRQFLAFGLVGLSGLGVSLLVVNCIMAYKGNFILANILAFFFAVTWNFFLNRRFTFQTSKHGNLVLQWAMFAVSCALGTACNWAVSFALYYNTTLFAAHYNLAIICGVAVGYIVNFTFAKYAVFKSRNDNQKGKSL